MKVVLFLTLFSLNLHSLYGQMTKGIKENSKKSAEKELDLVDFNSIKDVLKHDQLEKSAEKKIEKVKKIKRKKLNASKGKYDIPSAEYFWQIASEYWLVKNATILKWNFNKPDYGIEEKIISTFKKLGIINLNFKILLLNTSEISHFYLPTADGELLVLLSVPFMRSLNLTRTEITLLVLENYIRSQMKLFEQKIDIKGLNRYIGGNYFKQRTVDIKPFLEVSKKYSKVVLSQGYDFQQQYAVTKKMKQYLSGESALEEAYIQLLSKIDHLVNSDTTYKYYVKLYPSPVVQRNWFLGKK